MAAEAHESQKLERLCRYIARPAIAEKRLTISPQGKVCYQIKTPWKNGTTHVEFEPVELMAHIPVRPPCGRPAVAQIGNPADLSSAYWRRWSRHHART